TRFSAECARCFSSGPPFFAGGPPFFAGKPLFGAGSSLFGAGVSRLARPAVGGGGGALGEREPALRGPVPENGVSAAPNSAAEVKRLSGLGARQRSTTAASERSMSGRNAHRSGTRPERIAR